LSSPGRTPTSPNWYEADAVVPTWNYEAVHAYGRPRIVEDRAALLDIVRQMIEVFERPMPSPWVLDRSTLHLERMLAQIVGFRIEAERLEGKFKLSQNHPHARRSG
jgi:transcriptional regulator